MIRWLGRLLLLRVLPRRLIPLLTVVEAVQLLRAARRQVTRSRRPRRPTGSAATTAAPRRDRSPDGRTGISDRA